MTWQTPPTFTDGAVLTAAQLNILRDDLNETAPAKATTVGSFFIGAGANSIVERSFSSSLVTTSEDTTSSTYTELTTLQNLSLVTSTMALVIVSAQLYTSTVNGICFSNFTVGGASSIGADDRYALMVTSSTTNARGRASAVTILTASRNLVAGTNTFKQVFKVSAGTLTAAYRELLVLPL